MKKQKMLITLAGLVAVVATSATITAYSLAGDGSSAPAGESAGTHEPAFQDDKPTFDPAPNTIDDGKGGVSVTNPDVKVDDTPPLHGDPTHETWLKDNPPTDDMSDTPPTVNPGPGQVSDDGSVFVDNPDTGGGAIGIPDPSGQGTEIEKPPPLHGDPPPPVGRPQQEPVDGNADPTPKDDVDDVGTEVVRVTPALADLEDNLLATGAEVKVSGEVVKQPFFSVDSRIIEVNGERVQVMEYGDAAALEAEAAGISPDGSSVGTTMVTWVGSPHFFRTESLIVLYVGESPTVIEALVKVMGPQFAGR